MRRFVPGLTLSLLLLVLAACSSVPTHFYTLLPPVTKATPVTAPYLIAVLPVTVPAQVDRPQMVVRTGSGSVALLEGERWIAPLGDEIGSAISSELTRQLGTKDVYGLTHARDTPVYRINLDVQRFESVPGRYTLLSAAWSVQAASGDGPLVQCTSMIHESVAQGYAALAVGHQRGLEELAGRMATVVRGLAQGHATDCPL